MDTPLAAYLPQDRRAALAHGEELPQDAYGAALFADITGFTPLTEALNRTLGARRGSVIGFAGDTLTCWFDGAGLEARGLRLEETSDIQASSLQPGAPARPARLRRSLPVVWRQHALLGRRPIWRALFDLDWPARKQPRMLEVDRPHHRAGAGQPIRGSGAPNGTAPGEHVHI